MNQIKMQYPIKFYMKKSIIFWTIIGCVFMFLLGCFTNYINENHTDTIIFIISILLMLFGILGFVGMVTVWLQNKPSITLYASYIELFGLFGRNRQVLWSQVKSVELTSWTYKSTKHWGLVIIPKRHTKKITRPLKVMTCDDLVLNEKEIFSLIEQSFKGEQPSYQPIEISLKNRFATNADFWLWMLMLGFLIMALFFGFLR